MNKPLLCRRTLGAAILLVGVAASASAAEVRPQQLVEQTIGEFLKSISEQREMILQDPEHARVLVDQIIMPHVDVDTTVRWMLGKHWRKATSDQRDRFFTELRGMLVRSYASALAEYNRGDEIKYVSERVSDDGKTALVRTKIPRSQGPQPADVVYRLHRKDDDWKVFDVTIEGVSVVTTYRSTFMGKIERQGLDSVIDELAALNRKN